MTDRDRLSLASFLRRVARRVELGEYVDAKVEHDTPVVFIGTREGRPSYAHTGAEVLTLTYRNVAQEARAKRKAERWTGSGWEAARDDITRVQGTVARAARCSRVG